MYFRLYLDVFQWNADLKIVFVHIECWKHNHSTIQLQHTEEHGNSNHHSLTQFYHKNYFMTSKNSKD